MIYLLLFAEFFKIGLFTFGGGFAMIPLIEQVVSRHNWIDASRFYDFIGVCESTPGPIAINMATFIGSAQGGVLGSIIATFGVVLPSFIIILLVASILTNFTDNKYFKAFLKGVKPVIVALISSTGFVLLVKSLGYVSITQFNFSLLPAIIVLFIACIYFGLLKFKNKKLSSINIILISAGLGLVLNLVKELI